jgi:hypothetical protein
VKAPKSTGKIRTDGDIVRKLRQLDNLLDKVRKIAQEIEDCAHPNAAAIFAALDAECVPLAWPSHVAHDCLEHPDRWETGAHDIRRKVAS